MDRVLLGHPYFKSAIDMACWDLLGKRSGMPVCDLMGGRQGGKPEDDIARIKDCSGKLESSDVMVADADTG